MTRRFEMDSASGGKFWEIAVNGSSTTIGYGAVGAAPRTSEKDHGSADKANKFADSQIRSKETKGYSEVAAPKGKGKGKKKAAAAPAPASAPKRARKAPAPAPAPPPSPPPATSGAPPVMDDVDPDSGLAGKGHILVEGGDIYNVDLALQDASVNSNKFYRIQVVQSSKKAKDHWLVQHWGRIGTKGQCKVEGPQSRDGAVAGFEKKYKQKAGTKFEDRHNTSISGPVSGKYTLTAVERLALAAGGRLADDNTVTFCLSWNDKCDLDIHVDCPDGQQCSFRQKEVYKKGKPQTKPNMFCQLDVDKMAHHYPNQVENIYIDTRKAPKGEYIFRVRLYTRGECKKKKIPWNATFNNTANGEDVQRELNGFSAKEAEAGDVEVVRFVL